MNSAARMSNPVSIAKIIALLSGAAVGALLARWCDELLANRAQKKSEYDKARYAQGLGPVSEQTSARTILTPEDLKPRNGLFSWQSEEGERDESDWRGNEPI
jgi:hypothetical protein